MAPQRLVGLPKILLAQVRVVVGERDGVGRAGGMVHGQPRTLGNRWDTVYHIRSVECRKQRTLGVRVVDHLHGRAVVVVGAGTMGRGIAEVALTAGCAVAIIDPNPSQLATAAEHLQRLSSGPKVHASTSLGDCSVAAEASAVIEAAPEEVALKQCLLQEIEATVPRDAVIATNTSSLSVTELASALQAPERLVGLHFFNPVPMMALVEVIPGHHTSPQCVVAAESLAKSWGKVVVRARSTPGFIVNRVARPYYGEAMRLVEEQIGHPHLIDYLLRGTGFRMGPFRLMDLVGIEVNEIVTKTIWAALHHDPQFEPSLIQREMVLSGRLGRKTSVGFYDYRGGPPTPPPHMATEATAPERVVMHGRSPMLETLIRRSSVECVTMSAAGPPAIVLPSGGRVIETRGRSAFQESRICGEEVTLVDRTLDPGSVKALAITSSSGHAPDPEAVALLLDAGVHTFSVPDMPGLVVGRTVAMLMTVAAEAWYRGVATQSDIDTAMTEGANHPAGPFQWIRTWGASSVIELLDNVRDNYCEPRYRVSRGLRLLAEDAVGEVLTSAESC